MVASYILAVPSLSQKYGFAKMNLWWVATVSEIAMMPTDWLSMLYLISMYKCLDARDVIYGLRGIMQFSRGEELLLPDYSKPVLEVYRDCVEAAFRNFENANVLLYLTGTEDPSWIPRWDVEMCFRNPFRFGRWVSWKPAGESQSDWTIDTTRNVLSLKGIAIDSVKLAACYNQRFFSNEVIRSTEGLHEMLQAWPRIMKIFDDSSPHGPLEPSVLVAAAVSLSFGLDERTDVADHDGSRLLYQFVAYLDIVLDRATFDKYIPSTLAHEAKDTDGQLFGKPVWDFQYPVSSIFVTTNGMIGCATCETVPGDLVFAPFGSTYPLVLRPEQDHFRVKGYSYVHGVMSGERRNSETQTVEIH
ncbi:hypothetical protein LTR08_007623 [Meristemomyces frigidus]|nr:hypothetical protein LTR08_007623 [Meristemomyces frigidus]